MRIRIKRPNQDRLEYIQVTGESKLSEIIGANCTEATKLVLQGYKIDEGKSIDELNKEHGDTFITEGTIFYEVAKDAKMFNVKTLAGENYHIYTEPDMSVKAIKGFLEDITGIEGHSQTLTHLNKKLAEKS